MKKLLSLALFALFSISAFAQEDSMPAYVAILTQGGFDQTGDPMTYGAGYPVSVSAMNQYQGKQVLPRWIQFVITDSTVADIRTYCEEWRKELEWDVLSSDLVTDTHVLKAYIKPEFVSSSGLNRLTRAQVEGFLNKWNAVVSGISLGEVTFQANVQDAIESQGFWNRDFSMFQWTEVGYDSATGIHSVEINYSGYTPNLPELAAIAIERGCTITNNRPAQKKVTIECSRANVFSKFKQSVKQAVDGSFNRRRWYVNAEGIQAAIDAGGSLSLTRQQAVQYFHNRLAD